MSLNHKHGLCGVGPVAEGYQLTGDPVATLQDSAGKLSCEPSILHVDVVVIIALTPPTTATPRLKPQYLLILFPRSVDKSRTHARTARRHARNAMMLALAFVVSQRKERKKGYTRGPYKKRDGKSNYTQLASNSGILGQISATSGSLSGSFAQGLAVQPDFQQNQPYFMAPVPNQSEQYFWA
ncbi:hypothetical protein D9619_005668 [Psilocybe cf. subviscida]|uniref:Uncharacterized protein n=1 Tax=Psilocybe cf. subviscida TaxID=2480587 RepID=A0A8H5BVU1_9AGAR|nr:hypothetical protein D9619_005668 [Psilocybe cf. subviscida]